MGSRLLVTFSGTAKRSHPRHLPTPLPLRAPGFKPTASAQAPDSTRSSQSLYNVLEGTALSEPQPAASRVQLWALLPLCHPLGPFGDLRLGCRVTSHAWAPCPMGALPQDVLGGGGQTLLQGLPLELGDSLGLPEPKAAVGLAWWHLCHIPLVSAATGQPRSKGRTPAPALDGKVPRMRPPRCGAPTQQHALLGPLCPPCWGAHAPMLAAQDSSVGCDSS